MARVQRRASERFLAWFGQTLESNPGIDIVIIFVLIGIVIVIVLGLVWLYCYCSWLGLVKPLSQTQIVCRPFSALSPTASTGTSTTTTTTKTAGCLAQD